MKILDQPLQGWLISGVQASGSSLYIQRSLNTRVASFEGEEGGSTVLHATSDTTVRRPLILSLVLYMFAGQASTSFNNPFTNSTSWIGSVQIGPPNCVHTSILTSEHNKTSLLSPPTLNTEPHWSHFLSTGGPVPGGYFRLQKTEGAHKIYSEESVLVETQRFSFLYPLSNGL